MAPSRHPAHDQPGIRRLHTGARNIRRKHERRPRICDQGNRKRRRRCPGVRNRRNRGDRPRPSAPGRLGDESPLPPLRTRQPPDPARRVRSRHDALSARPRRHAAARRTEHGRRIRLLPCGDRLRTAYDPLPRRFDRLFRDGLHRLQVPKRPVGNTAGRRRMELPADRHRPPAISRPPPATPGRRKSTPTASRPGSRRASIRPYTPVTASAKTFTWKIRAATTCSPPILR